MTYPTCSEDTLLVLDHGTWACGPARDDQPYTLDPTLTITDGSCTVLLGMGDYAHGAWSSYACVRFDAPPTATPAPTAEQQVLTPIVSTPTSMPDTATRDAPLMWDLGLGIVLIAALVAMYAVSKIGGRRW